MRHPTPFAAVHAHPVHPRPVVLGHWVSAALLVFVFSFGLAREWIDDKTARTLLLDSHRAIGLLIGSLALLRLAVRSRWAMARTWPPLPAWQRWMSALLQISMYGLLLSLPVLGWWLSNARGAAVSLPLIGPLPKLATLDLDLADTLQSWHTWAAWTLLTLIALHGAAAVWHHHMRRDGVLAAMWPGLRPKTPVASNTPAFPPTELCVKD